MTLPPDFTRHGLRTGAAAVAGAGLVGADHQTTSTAPPHNQHKTIHTNPGAPVEQPAAMATPTDIWRST